MCRSSSPTQYYAEKWISSEESLLIYCKPIELYNIICRRSLHNPSFLRRCLHYKIQARRKRRSRIGIVFFNYRDYNNMHQKTEVTEDFSCPFCSMRCATFKGLRFHLCSSHDLFNFEFWVTEEYQAVNVSVKIDILRTESVDDAVDPRLPPFFFCSKPRPRKPKGTMLNDKCLNVQFLELDSPMVAGQGRDRQFMEKDDDVLSCKGETESAIREKELLFGKQGEYFGLDCLERVASSYNDAGIPIAIAQSSRDPECPKSTSRIDPALPSKIRRSNADRSDSKNHFLLQKRQFYHSHRVQPMGIDQVTSDLDSEDEVDDDIADLEDQRMLDDFVDVTKDEKQLMHLWNSFVRKQRVLADGHVSWACEAFSKAHGKELISSAPLFWCWRLFMIKLWNHGLVDASIMNNCNIILEEYRNGSSDSAKPSEDDWRIDMRQSTSQQDQPQTEQPMIQPSNLNGSENPNMFNNQRVKSNYKIWIDVRTHQ